MIREAQILLSDLKFGNHVGSRHRAKQRMKWFARLKVDWTVLYLKQDVWRELPIERLKVLVRGAGAVVARFHVIDKRAPHHNSVVRRHGRSKHVRAIRMRAIVSARTGLTFAVCLHYQTAKIGNQFVELVRFLFPPTLHLRIQRIRSLQPADIDWCREPR